MQQNILNKVLDDIDLFNLNDPNLQLDELGYEHPKELLYGQRMSKVLFEFMPSPSPELQIAARAQHIGRWLSPRGDYPEGRTGYLKWRTDLSKKHAQLCSDIMRRHQFEEASIEQVCGLLRKEKLKRNPLTQALEDVICLVFLEYYFIDFAAKHEQDKVLSIVKKTWGKMSEQGHEAALALKLPSEASDLIKLALAS